jgi:hypothetical protein
VTASIATVNDGGELVVQAGRNQISKRIEATGDWGAFKIVKLGEIKIAGSGVQAIDVRPKDASSWKPINLRFIKLNRLAD